MRLKTSTLCTSRCSHTKTGCLFQSVRRFSGAPLFIHFRQSLPVSMGRSSRHSKNAGVMGAEGLTYNEKRGLGYGTVRERLGKDAVGNYYDCRLTLTPAVEPVCTPKGILYSREAILDSLLEQKKANKRKFAAWKAEQDDDAQKAEERAAVAEQTKLIAFDKQNHMGASQALTVHLSSAIQNEAEAMLNKKRFVAGAVNIQQNADSMKEMKAFWLPSKTPEARRLTEQPQMNTICPSTGKKLKLKDLIQVRFTPVPDGEDGFAMDPVTKDAFSNANRLVVLKPTGDVVLWETWQKYIKPDGNYEGSSITDEDVVELQKGGTGFAKHDGEQTQSSRFWYLGPGTGRQDLRGQHQAAQSKGGLVFRN